MSSPISDAQAIAEAMAAWFDELGLGTWERSSGAYTAATEWPIYIGPDMPTTPHRLILITPTVQERLRADIVQSVQVRFRGAQDAPVSTVRDRAQAVMDACYPNGFPRVHTRLGDCNVGAIMFTNWLEIDSDSIRRHGSIQNYRVRFRRARP